MNSNTYSVEALVEYVRANGRRVQRFEESGSAESEPCLDVVADYIRLGNLELHEDGEGHVALTATNRRIARSHSAFVLNEPYASGAVVVIHDTFPNYAF